VREKKKPKQTKAVPVAPPVSPMRVAWDAEFFERHLDDDPDRDVPGLTFLQTRGKGDVGADLLAIVAEVAATPPPAFRNTTVWQAMHGSMTGWFEARKKRGKTLYRLFCLLEREPPGLARPSLVIITGLDKPVDMAFSEADYAEVRALGDEYRARSPRSVLSVASAIARGLHL